MLFARTASWSPMSSARPRACRQSEARPRKQDLPASTRRERVTPRRPPPELRAHLFSSSSTCFLDEPRPGQPCRHTCYALTHSFCKLALPLTAIEVISDSVILALLFSYRLSQKEEQIGDGFEGEGRALHSERSVEAGSCLSGWFDLIVNA